MSARLWVVVLLLMGSGGALADYEQLRGGCNVPTQNQAAFDEMLAACTALVNSWNPVEVLDQTNGWTVAMDAIVCVSDPLTWGNDRCGSGPCPAGQTHDKTGQCTTGQNNNCFPKGFDPASSSATRWVKFTGASFPETVCINGCEYDTGTGLGNGTSGGMIERAGSTGKTCTGTATDASQQEKGCAAKGELTGTVNGKEVCYPPASSKDSATKKTTTTSTTSPDSAGQTTTVVTTCSGDGSCTTTTTTNNTSTTGGTATTPGTTTDLGSTTTTTTEGQGSYCSRNPNDPVCKGTEGGCDPTVNPTCDDSVSVTDCDSAPSCGGDVMLCAIITETWKTECSFSALAKTMPADSVIPADSPGGTDAQKAAGDAALNSAGLLDINILNKFNESRQNYLSFSGSCPSVPSISFGGQTFTIDTSVFCSFGNFVRLMVHVAAYLLVIRLLSRTFA